MMIIIKYRIGKRRSHVSYLLSLCHKIQHTVFNVLQNVGSSIGTVQVDITLRFAHKGFIT